MGVFVNSVSDTHFNSVKTSNDFINMKYPTVSEYIESLRCASDNFATCTSLSLIYDSQGRTKYKIEKHCVIFQMVDTDSEIEYDVKCFTDEQEGRKDFYDQIMNGQSVWYPNGIAYLEKELFVDTANSNEKEFPIVINRCCKVTDIVSFIITNKGNSELLTQLAYSLSILQMWVYDNGYFWHDLNTDSLYVEDNGHIFVSNIDEIIEASKQRNNKGDLNAALILLSLKAIIKDNSLFDANNIRPQILFDTDRSDDLPTSETIGKLLNTGDSEMLSIIGAIFIHIGQKNFCGIKSSAFKVTPPTENKDNDLILQAESGNAAKQVELANQYRMKEMYEESFKWYERAASQNNNDGIYGLGMCYRKGLGTEKDLVKAYQCFLKASESGLLEAQFELAEAYYFGWGVRRNTGIAIDLYYKAAQRGHAMSEFMIGHHLMSNHGEIDSYFTTTSKRDTAKAFEWFMKSAQQGYHPAQRRIGAFYETGTDPCVRNISKAMEWYQKAAAQGNDKALFAIGRLYANGLDEKNPDNQKAFEYYLQAAEKGLRDAQYRVGIALLFGKGVNKDKDSAVEWVRKSAEQGYASAKKLLFEIEHNAEDAEETEATGLEIASATIDEYGVLYSQDGKKLLRYSIEEGYDSVGYYEGTINMFDEEGEFGSIKQQSLNHYEVKEGTEIICDNAFDECESLQSISFPMSLKKIGNFAFYHCDNLEFVELNEGLEEIGSSAFNGCMNLENLTLPRSLKSIDAESIIGVHNILSLSKYSTSTSNCLFTADMRTLIYFFHDGEDYFEIPYGVERIGDYAFSESEIKHVVIPETVIEIGNEAFSRCSNLEEIHIPQSVEKIGSAAFFECEHLHKVNLPQKLEIIEPQVFEHCRNLGYINIPNTVKIIGAKAFGSTNIKSSTLPQKLEIFGYDPFVGCDLQYLDSLSDKFVVKDMAIYTDNGKTFVNYYGKERRFEIPIGVDRIADYALSFAYSIQELSFPITIKQIGKSIMGEILPKKIFVSSEAIKTMLLENLPSYYAERVFVIENDSN